MTLETVKNETGKDEILQKLIEDIVNKKYCRNSLKEYKAIFDELYYIDGIVMRGNQIVIPKSLQADIIGLAHEAHLGQSKTKTFLRQSCWFPNMSKLVDQYIESCLACQSANPHTST